MNNNFNCNICSSCGKPNPSNVKFCSSCGNMLYQKRRCPSCNIETPDNASFCGNCGANLQKTPNGPIAPPSNIYHTNNHTSPTPTSTPTPSTYPRNNNYNTSNSYNYNIQRTIATASSMPFSPTSNNNIVGAIVSAIMAIAMLIFTFALDWLNVSLIFSSRDLSLMDLFDLGTNAKKELGIDDGTIICIAAAIVIFINLVVTLMHIINAITSFSGKKSSSIGIGLSVGAGVLGILSAILGLLFSLIGNAIINSEIGFNANLISSLAAPWIQLVICFISIFIGVLTRKKK